jgi:hypothetical protein
MTVSCSKNVLHFNIFTNFEDKTISFMQDIATLKDVHLLVDTFSMTGLKVAGRHTTRNYTGSGILFCSDVPTILAIRCLFISTCS